MTTVDLNLDSYQLGWSDEEDYVYKPEKGLSEQLIRDMSRMKKEPEWMLEFRLKAYKRFLAKPMPQWVGDGALNEIDFDDIYYYIKPTEGQVQDWDMVPDSIKETYEKLGIPEAERKYLAGVTAQYECLRGDVRVYTADRGTVPIKEIVPGDRVFSLNEDTGELEIAPVKSAAQTGVEQTYRLTVGSRFGRSIHATGNHPILTLTDARKPGRQRARYQRRWRTIDEIEVGDLVAVARDVPLFGTSHRLATVASTPDAFPVETSADLMWLLGFWLGDGYTRNDPRYGTYRIELAAPESDREVQSEIGRVATGLFGLTTTHPDVWRVSLGSKALVEWLEANAITGNSHTKRIPGWVFGLPLDQRLAFLGGYVDADGYVSPDHHGNVVSVTSVNVAMLGDVEDLARLCGLRPSGPYEFNSKHPFDQDRIMTGFRMGIGGDVERLGLRNPKRFNRLGRRAYRQSDTGAHGTTFRSHVTDTLGFARVVEIESADVAPVYDIEIDGPHNFVAEGVIVHNSEVVYHRNREDLEGLGVLFTDMDTAVREYPEIVQEYFGTIIPPGDNKFAALNSAVWSGGSFIYIPPGVHLDEPLQAYFRINAENMGQFERTLIIVDEGAFVHYVEGCSAPVYSSDSLHSAVVEIVVKEGGRARYSTIQNWSNNVYNLVTKRAVAYKNATMEWVDGNLGCLAEGSTVTTRGGVKPIELVRAGDQVLSFDEWTGRFVFRTVNGVRYSGMQPVRTISSGVRSIQATDNHPFYSYTYDPEKPSKLGRYQLDYVRADKIERVIMPASSIDYGRPQKMEPPDTETTFRSSNQHGAEFTATRKRPGRLEVPDETTEDLMWLFGLFTGDGSIDAVPAANGGYRNGNVTFSVPRSDRARTRLMDVMGSLMPGAAPTDRADGVAIRWNSVALIELFERNGFSGSAATKRLPSWIVDLPEAQRISFIAGYLDSDGCAARGRRAFTIKSVNKDLLIDTAEILTTLGISGHVWTEHGDEREAEILGIPSVSRGSHRLEFPTDARLVSAVSEGLSAAVARQAPAINHHHRLIGRSNIVLPETVEVRKVTVDDPGPEVPTWDIEVEGTGNFVSQGFIVHNSKFTAKYPAVWLMEEGAHGEVLSIAMAGAGQHLDAGAKIVHVAPNTTSLITSKSISIHGGRAGYRGLVRVEPGAEDSRSFVRCDALILDEDSRSDTYPYMEVEESNVDIGHEATVSKVGEDQLFYLMSRGLTEEQATAMVVAGFIEPIVKELPMEYAVELNRLVELQMEGSVG